MSNPNMNQLKEVIENRLLSFLDQRQVAIIDEAQSTLGGYGEVRLIVEKGRLRFLITQKSFDALIWQPSLMSD